MLCEYKLKNLLPAFVVSVLLLFAVVQTTQAVSEYVNETDLTGFVYDATNEEPLADATLTISETGQTTNSDADGWFEFSELEPGTYTIEVDREGFEEHSETVEVAEGGASIEIGLTPDE